MIQCHECRMLIPDDSAYCDQCGVELKWCPECKRPKRGTECPVCGTDLISGRKYLAMITGPSTASSTAPAPQPAPRPVPQPTVAMSSAPAAPVSLEGNGWSLTLQDGEFGRSGGIWPQLASCQYVSGRHGRIQCSPGRVEIVDVGSTNGTYLNGLRLQTGMPTQIKPGDRLKIASLDFIVK